MTETKTFTPEFLPRRGEITAWVLAIVAAFGLYFLGLRQPLPFWAWFFVIFLIFSAASISFGNWVDRRTLIRLEPGGVAFENGLRNTRLDWDIIQEVRTAPARWGTSVQVIGTLGHFSFSTLGEMQFMGQSRGRTGFVEGSLIFDEIIRCAGLTKTTQTGPFLIYSRP
jgi:hypothetical protein